MTLTRNTSCPAKDVNGGDLMRTWYSLRNQQTRKLPAQFQDYDDIRYTEGLVELFVQEFTQEGDVIFDPFAGFGTTLFVAESLGRRGFGLEYDADRADYIRHHLRAPDRLIHGDARQLETYAFPCFDLSMTSPPYMYYGNPTNPFTAYTTEGQGYEAYLRDLQHIYRQMKTVMNPGAHVVLEVANLKHENTVTTLGWDIGKAIGEILTFCGEIIVTWDVHPHGYDHSYCLVFTTP